MADQIINPYDAAQAIAQLTGRSMPSATVPVSNPPTFQPPTKWQPPNMQMDNREFQTSSGNRRVAQNNFFSNVASTVNSATKAIEDKKMRSLQADATRLMEAIKGNQDLQASGIAANDPRIAQNNQIVNDILSDKKKAKELEKAFNIPFLTVDGELDLHQKMGLKTLAAFNSGKTQEPQTTVPTNSPIGQGNPPQGGIIPAPFRPPQAQGQSPVQGQQPAQQPQPAQQTKPAADPYQAGLSPQAMKLIKSLPVGTAPNPEIQAMIELHKAGVLSGEKDKMDFVAKMGKVQSDEDRITAYKEVAGARMDSQQKIATVKAMAEKDVATIRARAIESAADVHAKSMLKATAMRIDAAIKLQDPREQTKAIQLTVAASAQRTKLLQQQLDNTTRLINGGQLKGKDLDKAKDDLNRLQKEVSTAQFADQMALTMAKAHATAVANMPNIVDAGTQDPSNVTIEDGTNKDEVEHDTELLNEAEKYLGSDPQEQQ